MGLFDFFNRLIFGGPAPQQSSSRSSAARDSNAGSGTPASSTAAGVSSRNEAASGAGTQTRQETVRDQRRNRTTHGPRPYLQPLRYQPSLVRTPPSREVVTEKPYRFGHPAGYGGKFLNLSKDGDQRWLDYFGLPKLSTPDDLAEWLGVPIGKLAWLCHRNNDGRRPKDRKKAHYHYSFRKKRSGGMRLIEAPKPLLAQVQQKILREILDNVPAHPAAHGFVQGRSIVTNARPHVGKRFILKLDLEQFYPSVKYSRVVAIFRSLGFSREVSLWLAQLTTTSIPWNMELPQDIDKFKRWEFLADYHPRHLPQGAPTSPALANLSAFALDVRLGGLANAYHLTYTRYADDLTFSGEARNVPALRQFIPLAMQIVRAERFKVNLKKRKVVRSNKRQTVTGVVVNEKINVSRKEYDKLKAILTNCVKQGPTTQNRDNVENFSHHLRGRIAHVSQLNPSRGEKLLAIYHKVDWTK